MKILGYARTSTDDQTTALQLAELERSLITERTRAGVKFGRKPKLSPAQIKHTRQQIDLGQRVQDVVMLLNVDRVTLYRALKMGNR